MNRRLINNSREDEPILKHMVESDLKLSKEYLSEDAVDVMPGVSCVFDLAGSTLSLRKRDSLKYVQKLKDMFKDLTNIIYEKGGVVEKFPGDGISFHFFDSMFKEESDYKENDCSAAVRAAFNVILSMDQLLRTKYGLKRTEYRFTAVYGKNTVITYIGSEKHYELISIGHGVNVAHKLEKELEPKSCFIGVDYTFYKVLNSIINVRDNIEFERYDLPCALRFYPKANTQYHSWYGIKAV